MRVSFRNVAIAVSSGEHLSVIAATHAVQSTVFAAWVQDAKTHFQLNGVTSLAVYGLDNLVPFEVKQNWMLIALERVKGLPDDIPPSIVRLLARMTDPRHWDKDLETHAKELGVASGQVMKDLDQLTEWLGCARTLHGITTTLHLARWTLGERRPLLILTPRQKQVLTAMVRGQSVAGEAETRQIMDEIAPKIGVHGPAGVLLWVLRSVVTPGQLEAWPELRFAIEPGPAARALLEVLLEPRTSDATIEGLSQALLVSDAVVRKRLTTLRAALPDNLPKTNEMVVVVGALEHLVPK